MVQKWGGSYPVEGTEIAITLLNSTIFVGIKKLKQCSNLFSSLPNNYAK